MIEFGAGMVVGAALLRLHAYLWATAPTRHGRYRMRAKLAQWLMDGKLSSAQARKGKLVVPALSMRRAKERAAAKRREVLRVVRRDDSTPGAA